MCLAYSLNSFIRGSKTPENIHPGKKVYFFVMIQTEMQIPVLFGSKNGCSDKTIGYLKN